MEFRVFGPLEVWSGGRQARLSSGKQNTLLAALLMRANRVVPVDELIDAVWGEDPPTTGVAVVQTYVLRLRQALSAIESGAANRIATHPAGYSVLVEPGELDLDVFGRHREQARSAVAAGRLDQAAEELRAGLALWRGPALSGVPGSFAAAQAVSLNESQLAAFEEGVDIDLQLGRAADVVPGLREMVNKHPLREGLRGLLMLALYRAGRQAEALAAFQDGRRQLLAELGVEPGPELQELHQRLLVSDPSLRLPAKTVAAPRGAAMPRQLPADITHFTGRQADLAALDAVVRAGGPSVVISAIDGIGGVGKTALAVHFGYRIAERFPDGQLYLNLRGFDRDQPPMAPGDALGQFLRALGVEPQKIPIEVEEQAALYRSTLGDKRVLVVLDNAATAEQVRPLLPGSAGCVALITSRHRLNGLVARDGAKRFTLDVLTVGEAVELMRQQIGAERIDAEPAMAAEVARLCGCLPLAVNIAAANIADQGTSLADAARALAEGNRLANLAIEDDERTAVRAAFDLSYLALKPELQSMFRLLSIVPGPDFTVQVAAALADTSVDVAQRLLNSLVAGHLVENYGAGRYRFHDLLRIYARERLDDTETESDRRGAANRMLDWYLHTVSAACHAFFPQHPLPPLDPAFPNCPAPPFQDYRGALSWCDADRVNLTVAVRFAESMGRPDVAWKMAVSLRGFFDLRKHWADWIETCDIGLQAARRIGDRTGEATVLVALGMAHMQLLRNDMALDLYSRALSIARELDSPRREAAALNNLAIIYRRLQRFDEALESFHQAAAINGRIGERPNMAMVLSNLGNTYASLRRFDEAIDWLRRSLEIRREVGDRRGTAITLVNLGEASRESGRLDEAKDWYDQSVSLHREIDDQFGVAVALNGLGCTYRDLVRIDQARANWLDALEILDRLGAAEADEVRGYLAENQQAAPSQG